MSLKENLQKRATVWGEDQKSAPDRHRDFVEFYLPLIVDAVVGDVTRRLEKSASTGRFTQENGRRLVTTKLTHKEIRYSLDRKTYYKLSEIEKHIGSSYPEVTVYKAYEDGYFVRIYLVETTGADDKIIVKDGFWGRQVKINFTPWGKVLLDEIQRRCEQEGIIFSCCSIITQRKHTYKKPYVYTRFGEFEKLPSDLKKIPADHLTPWFEAHFECEV